jgi:D-allulose-6-phosphate 3-epimerase
MITLIAPSAVFLDLFRLEDQINFFNEVASFYHVDIMDNHFVRNMALSHTFVAQLRKKATIPIDAHLMVTEPYSLLDCLLEAGADYITPHIEAVNSNVFTVIKKIKDGGAKAGIAVNPATPINHLHYFIDRLDKITLMTIDPGFAGQPFLEPMLEKIRELRTLKNKQGFIYLIEIDGQCNEKYYQLMKEAGAEVFVVGPSGLFGLNSDIRVAWKKMMAYMQKGDQI